ncbi:TonB-dependent receptor domain-containing protein [Novosphingobium resinovorum]|uniref:TonB-dependent receptor domain-containing protein n=1 Tax=Novosphingobium resinovorum TaxID=158500 RepID=UPI002ED09951|nr:TonB-dependent receptor [Novosphingobium resinovorum]
MISKFRYTRPRRLHTAASAFLLAGSGLAAVAFSASPALAQSARGTEIAPGALADALNTLAEQSGVQILYDAALTEGRRTAGIKGRFSPTQALSRLLAGTGLTFRQTAPRVYTLERAPQAAAGTVQLGTLRVAGADDAAGTGTARGGEGSLDPANRPYRSAQSTAYISAEQIAQNRGTSPGDFLRGIPGVLNGDNRNSGALDVNIRGMQGMDRVPVVIDGSLQQSTVYRGYSGVAGRSYLDPDLMGSVTIEKGPSAAADGVGATGGVVRANTVSVNDLVAPDENFGIRVRAGLQGNNVDPPEVGALGTGGGTADRFDRPGLLDLNGYSFSVAAAHRFESFDLVAAYARRKTGNYFGGEHGTVPPGGTSITGGVLQRYNLGEEVLSTSQDNTSILLRAIVRPTDDTALDLSYMRYESDFAEMMPSQIIRFGGAMQSPPSRTEVNTYTARFRWNPSEGGLIDLHADAWATDNFTSIATLYRYNFGTGTILNQDVAYQSQSNRWGLRLWNDSAFATPLGAATLSYGGSYTRERIKPPKGWEDYKDNADYASFLEPRNGWRNEYSAYVSGELKPADWMTFAASLRYITVESQDYNLVNISTSSAPDRDYATGHNHEKNSGVSPIVSLTLEPVPGLQVFARYAEALRAPSLFESTTGFSFYPDPDNPARPERARNTEVGINYQADGLLAADDLLQARVSYYANHIDNYLTRGVSDGLTSVVNIDSAAFQGAELSLRYDMGKVYAEVGGSLLTYQQFCDTAHSCRSGGTSNSYVPAQLPPRESLSVTLGTRLLDERLHLGTRYTHMGKRDATVYTFGGSMTTVDWQPYDLFDLFGDFRIDDRFGVEFGIDNVTDRYYMDALTLGLMPSPGRTFRVGFTGSLGGPRRQRSDAASGNAMEAYLSGKSAADGFDGDWSGFHLGVTTGYGQVVSKGRTTDAAGVADAISVTESADVNHGDMQWGGLAGYDFDLGGDWVAGFEANFTRMRNSTTRYAIAQEVQNTINGYYNMAPDQEAQAATKYDFEWMATARARLGFKTGRALFYGIGGVAFLREKQQRTQYIDTASPDNLYPDGPYGYMTESSFTESARKTRKGWTIGAGAEVAMGSRWSLRAEYSYARFAGKDFRFDDARSGVGKSYTVRTVVGYEDVLIPGLEEFGPFPQPIFSYQDYTGTYDVVNGRRARNSAEVHGLTLGISYRF